MMKAMISVLLVCALLLTAGAVLAEDSAPFDLTLLEEAFDSLICLVEGCYVSDELVFSDEMVYLSVGYEEITLARLMEWMLSLDDLQWYGVENSFHKGHGYTMNAAYQLDTGSLQLDFTIAVDAAEWPETLWPSARCEVPAFSYGEYAGIDDDALSIADESLSMLFDGVTSGQIEEYADELTAAGFVLNQENEVYEYGLYTVTIDVDEDGRASVTVGEDVPEVGLMSLLWLMPAGVFDIPMTMDADLEIIRHENVIYVSAEGMSLSDLRGFLVAAETVWATLDENNQIALPNSDWVMQIIDYDSALETATIVFAEIPVAEDGVETEEEDNSFAFTDYTYVVTSGSYLPENALDGARQEYGSAAQLADWADIAALYSEDITAFMDAAGIGTDVDVWLRYNGDSYNGQRLYFLARISEPRESFLVHEQIGDTVWLGSWYGIEQPALVILPLE